MMYSIRTGFAVFLLITLLQQQCFAQKLLLQENQNTGRHTEYKLNDAVILKTRANKTQIVGVITNIADSTLTINNKSTLRLTDIGYLKPIDKNYHLLFVSGVFSIAGVFYPAIDILNRVINNQWPIPASTGYIAGAFLGTSLITEYLINKHYKLRRNKKLRVIDISIIPVKE